MFLELSYEGTKQVVKKDSTVNDCPLKKLSVYVLVDYVCD